MKTELLELRIRADALRRRIERDAGDGELVQHLQRISEDLTMLRGQLHLLDQVHDTARKALADYTETVALYDRLWTEERGRADTATGEVSGVGGDH